MSAQAAACVFDFILTGQQGTQAKDFTQLADTTMLGRGVGHEIQQIARQLMGWIFTETALAGIHQALDLALDLAHALLEFLAGLEGLGPQGFQDPGRNPEQAPSLDFRGNRDQPIAGLGQVIQRGIDINIAEPLEQGHLELAAQLFGTPAQFGVL